MNIGSSSSITTAGPTSNASVKPLITFLEPNLRLMDGHYLNYGLALTESAIRQGFRVQICTDVQLSEEVRDSLSLAGAEVKPLFKWRKTTFNVPKVINWSAASLEYYRVTRQLATDRPLIICTYSGQMELLLGATFASYSLAPTTKILTQMFEWKAGTSTTAPRATRIYQELIELAVKGASRRNFVICGQTEAISRHISSILKMFVSTTPMIHDWSAIPTPHAIATGRKISIGYLGSPKNSKGFDQFQESIRLLSAETIEQLSFSIQAHSTPGPEQAPFEEIITSLQSRLGGRLKTYRTALSRSDYYALLNELDIVCLPYAPEVYRHKTSGIFGEAVGSGKIIIAPRNTWMGSIVDKFGLGVTYYPYTNAALAEAIETAVIDCGRIRETVAEFAPTWRAQHNATAFLQQILAICGYSNTGESL